MANFSYLNFDVQIQRAGDSGYRVLVEAPSGETVRAPFEMPFSELELENFMLKAGPSRRGVRRADTPELDAAKRFGEKLYGALFTADVRSALQSSLDQARRRGETGRERFGVRLRLRLAEVPELAGIPWEYIYNPALNRFFALSTETPLVRYLDLPERIRPAKVVQPLRVLAMVAAPSDHARLDVRQEWFNLNSAVADLQEAGLVQLDLLEVPTLTGLQRQLRQGDYHIFHFIGHGAFSRSDADGLLIFEDDDGRGRPVSGQDLAMLLHDHAPLRLAVLNACEGALSATDDPFAGVAQSLVQGGLPAVIAMQFEITDRAAIVFAHEFYRALADDYPVDAALTEARKVVLTESRGSGLEWGTPVLYMRSPDGRIFNLQKRRQPTTTAPLPSTSTAAATTYQAPPEPVEAFRETAAQEHTAPAPSLEPAQSVAEAAGLHTETIRSATPPETTAIKGSDQAPPTQAAVAPAGTKRNINRLFIALAAIALLIVTGVGLFMAFNGTSPPPVSPEQASADAEANYNAGLTARDNSDLDTAIAEFSEAIALKPDYTAAYLRRAETYRSKDMLDESIADFGQAIKLVPSDGYAYLERGTTYMYKSNYDSALPDLTRAVELLPAVSQAYFQRGFAYLEMNRLDEAIDDFNKVLDLQPTWVDAYQKRGNAYARKTDYETAIENYTRAIELQPDGADSFYFDRAEAYRLLGDDDAAIADYKAAIDQTDSDYLREQAEQHLQILEK